MPELLRDWLTGRAVIVAEQRARRPNDFAKQFLELEAAPAGGAAGCPFCPGHESDTPPAVYEHTGDDGRWSVRVVPNRYPALTPAPDASSNASPAIGVHEVIVESPRHVERLSALSAAELAQILQAYRARLGHWHDCGRYDYGLIFKNSGLAAGASLVHVHSQLVAMPEAPQAVAGEFARAEQSYRDKKECPYCRWIHEEQAANERVVIQRDGLIAFCPLVSLQPFETWIFPIDHEPWFERPSRADTADRLAVVLRDLLPRIEAFVPGGAYNLILRTAPWRESAMQCGHWRIEILPRSAAMAGIELATGVHINLLSARHAAERLRSQ